MATIAALATAAAGAYSANRQAAAAKAAANAGRGSSSGSSDPWGPSQGVRQQILGASSDYLQSYLHNNNQWNYYDTVGGNGSGAGGGGGQPGVPAGASVRPDGRIIGANGRTIGNTGAGAKAKAKGAGGGAGAGAPAAAPVNIAQNMAQHMQDRALGGSPYYQPAQDTALSMMNGTNNPIRDRAQDMMASFGQDGNNVYLDEAGARSSGYENPYLRAYLDANQGQYTGGGGGGMQGAHYGGGGGGISSSGASGPGGAGPVGAAAILRAKLAEDPYSDMNPAVKRASEGVARRIREEYEQTVVPGITSAWAGSGRYGGGLYADAQGQAAGKFQQNLGDQVGAIEYQGYKDAMDRWQQNMTLGTQYDMNDANNATSRANTATSAGASGAAASMADARAREQMYLQAVSQYGSDSEFGINGLMNAASLQNNAQQFGSSGMMNAANMFSQDQTNALGMVPTLSGMDMRDMQGAYGAGMGIDQLALQRQLGQGQLSIARGGLNLQQQQYQNMLQQQQMMQPFQMLGMANDVVNGASGGYGTQNGNYQNPYQAPQNNTLQAGIGGALTGLAAYNQFAGQQQPNYGSFNNGAIMNGMNQYGGNYQPTTPAGHVGF